MEIPLNIINVVCRTHPGIAISTSDLYLGAKGTIVLHKDSATVRSGGTVIGIVRRTLRGDSLPSSTIRLVRSADQRATSKVFGLGRCLSILVPQKKTGLVGAMIRGSAIPMLRANTNGYRICVSRDTSGRVTVGVTVGTGARHPSIYGTYRAVVIRER